ncbi:hypothetical protein DRN63_04710 [Nanoarchaeota archaeon]|nr:MAG: hypothetical protein DRN63_04710 [Nanoarchaeota archaeon]
MNLLVISETFYPEGRGGEVATYLYAKLLKERGLNVKVLSTTTRAVPLAGKVEGLSVYRIPKKKATKYWVISDFIYSNFLMKLFEWSDVIYMTGRLHLIPQLKRLRKPIVIHLHSSFPACPLGSAFNFMSKSTCSLDKNFLECFPCIILYEKLNGRNMVKVLASSLLNSTLGMIYDRYLAYADALLFVSNFHRDVFLSKFPTFSNKSFVIYNPLPQLPYLEIKGDDLGYFGGIDYLKGFYVLIQAWLKILGKHDSFIHIAPASSQKRVLKRRRIVLYPRLRGRMYDEVYKHIRAVLVPSIAPETFSYVVSEACLRGRIVVASQVGGIPEITEGLRGVFMVKPNDINSLADALDLVLSMDRSEAIELGLKNREGILRKFNSRRSVNELVRVFEKVVG